MKIRVDTWGISHWSGLPNDFYFTCQSKAYAHYTRIVELQVSEDKDGLPTCLYCCAGRINE
jgi:hypothetical protein